MVVKELKAASTVASKVAGGRSPKRNNADEKLPLRERIAFKACAITAVASLLIGMFVGIFLVPTWFITPCRNLLSDWIAVPVEEQAPDPTELPDAAGLLGSFNDICSLATIEYSYRGVGDTGNMSSVDLPVLNWMTNKRLLIKYHGMMKAGVNLTESNITVDDSNKTVTVILPEAELFDSYIVAGSEEIVLENESAFNQLTEQERDAFRAGWLTEMEGAARDEGILDKASENAKKSLKEFAETFLPDGYNVEVLTQAEYEQALAVSASRLESEKVEDDRAA